MTMNVATSRRRSEIAMSDVVGASGPAGGAATELTQLAGGLLANATGADRLLADRIVDTVPMTRTAIEGGKAILLEGQLGVMRDLDWGIYPYVTSSNPTAAFASSGAGLPARTIDRVIGVEVGVPADPAAEVWDVSLAVRFERLDDVEPYRVDPIHRAYVDDYLASKAKVVKAWNFAVP